MVSRLEVEPVAKDAGVQSRHCTDDSRLKHCTENWPHLDEAVAEESAREEVRCERNENVEVGVWSKEAGQR